MGKKIKTFIDEAQVDGGESLVAAHSKLSKFSPKIVASLPRLTSVYLSNNNISKLPEDVSQLSRLEIVDLSSNKFSNFPLVLTSLSNLHQLHLSDNNLAVLPKDIFSLPLHILNVDRNKLTSLPAFPDHCPLTELLLSNNRITDIPESISKAASLKVLSVPANQLKQLPNSLGVIESLEVLNLRSNKLERIPSSICRLTALRKLNVNDNLLVELPNNIGACESLAEFLLSGNKLKHLPESVCRLGELRMLGVAHNLLLELPSAVGELTRLSTLLAHDNKLETLPFEITSCTALEELTLADNPLPKQALTAALLSPSAFFDFLIEERETINSEMVEALLSGKTIDTSCYTLSETMPPYELWSDLYNKLIAHLNFDEAKEAAMHGLPPAQKWDLVTENASLVGQMGLEAPQLAAAKRRGKGAKDEDPGRLLTALKKGKTAEFKTLRICLTSKSITWLEAFTKADGCTLLVKSLAAFVATRRGKNKPVDGDRAQAELELLRCVSVLLSTLPGFNALILNESLIPTICACALWPVGSKAQVLGLLALADLCTVSFLSHEAVLEALTSATAVNSPISPRSKKAKKAAAEAAAAGECGAYSALMDILTAASIPPSPAIPTPTPGSTPHSQESGPTAAVDSPLPHRESSASLALSQSSDGFSLAATSLASFSMDALSTTPCPYEYTSSSLSLAALTFIVNLVTYSKSLEKRMYLRSQFLKLGIVSYFHGIMSADNGSDEALKLIEQFYQEMRDDQEETTLRFSGSDQKHVPRDPNGPNELFLSLPYHHLIHTHPYAPDDTLMEVIMQLTNEFALSEQDDLVLCIPGPTPSSKPQWLLDSSATFSGLGLKGQIPMLLKPRPWHLAVRVGGAVRVMDLELPRSALCVDLTQLLKAELGEAETADQVLISKDSRFPEAEPKWLEDSTLLLLYDLERPTVSVGFGPRPAELKIRFSDHQTRVLRLDPTLSVRETLGRLSLLQNQSSSLPDDYGLYADGPGPNGVAVGPGREDGVWLENAKPLAEYNLSTMGTIHFKMRPQLLSVTLSSGQHVQFPFPLSETVHTLKNALCQAYSLDPATHLVAAYKPGSAELRRLFPDLSLKAQAVSSSTNLACLTEAQLATATPADTVYKELRSVWDDYLDLDIPLGQATPDPLFKCSRFVVYDWETEPVDDGPFGRVSGATLNFLVLLLTSEEIYDLGFLSTFLMTFQSFTNADVLLDKLIERYTVPYARDGNHVIPEASVLAVHMRVFDVLRHWVELHGDSLTDPLQARLKQFLDHQLTQDGHTQMASRIQTALEDYKKGVGCVDRFSEASPPSKIPRVLRQEKAQGLSLLAIDELEIARQLCLLEFGYYRCIRPVELLSNAWSKPALQHRAPNLMAIIGHFNALSSFAATSVVDVPTLRERAKVLAKWVRIAGCLLQLHNFNGVMAVLSGLANASVNRLKWTRQKLSKTVLQHWAEMEKLMSMESSYGKYRQTLRSSKRPCLPYMGVYLTDLVFIEDGNPDYLSAGGSTALSPSAQEIVAAARDQGSSLEKARIINFNKRRFVYKVMLEIQTYQGVGYNLRPVPDIRSYLSECLGKTPLSDAELYNLSLQLEPRGADRAAIQ